MDSKKNGNLAKLVAFFLIVTVLIMAVAFSVSGWQGENPGEPDSGESQAGGTADENTDGDTTDDTEEPIAPVYTHYISGLVITEEESLLKPLCLIYDIEAPMYGISSSFLTVEIPTEGGKSRLLAFTNDATSLGKLGALAPTRKYISSIAASFGAIEVCIGNDDSFEYTTGITDEEQIDLSKQQGYHYTEYGLYSYTNSDLLNACIKNNGTNAVMTTVPEMPYTFLAQGERANGSIQAATAVIQLDKSSTSELIYSQESGKYKLLKNTRELTDKLDDSALLYDNAIILFSDSATYETASKTQLIMDTAGGGGGYYLNGGVAQKITWSTSDAGALIMLDDAGQTLAIEPGSTYIAFAKSSQSAMTKLA